MPSVVPWRFLLNRSSDSLAFYTLFRDSVSAGVWSNLSNSGRERFLKGANFHLQYKINELEFGTCIECLNSIYHSKLHAHIALNALTSRCFALLGTVNLSQTDLLEFPKLFFEDSTHSLFQAESAAKNNQLDQEALRHLFSGEIIYKITSLGVFIPNYASKLNEWLKDFIKIYNKKHLLLSLFMATNLNDPLEGDSSKMLAIKVAELTSESFDDSCKYLLLYIIAKLVHNRKIGAESGLEINQFTNFIQDTLNVKLSTNHSPTGQKEAILFAIEAFEYFNKVNCGGIDYDRCIGTLSDLYSVTTSEDVNKCSSDFLLQFMLDFNVKSPILWNKFEQLYKANPIPELSLYMLDSYINYKRPNGVENLDILKCARKVLSKIRDGELSKLTSNTLCNKNVFLELAKKFRQMVKGKVVKVEPCGLYVEIPTNDDPNAAILGYVSIFTFPNTFEERIDKFFAPGNHFHVRILSIPENFSATTYNVTSIVKNDDDFLTNDSDDQVLIKKVQSLVDFEPANLDFDTNAIKKRLRELKQSGKIEAKALNKIYFAKGEMVNATSIVCHESYKWALFKLQCVKTGEEASKLGILDTGNIRGDPIEKLRLLRKIEQGQPFRIKITGTIGPLYSLNYSKYSAQTFSR